MHRLTVALLSHLAARRDAIRVNPDAGLETVEKILWAAAAIVIAGGAGLLIRNKINEFINALAISLGW